MYGDDGSGVYSLGRLGVKGGGVEGKEETGRTLSEISAFGLSCNMEVSYAIVVSNICRNIIRKSSMRSCAFDGALAG